MALNEQSGNHARPHDKHSQNWPDPPLVEDDSKGSSSAQSENVLVSSTALRSMLRTGTELGDIDLVVTRSRGNGSRPLTRGRFGLNDHQYLPPAVARGNPSRLYAPRVQGQRIQARTTASRESSTAGYSHRGPSGISRQRTYQETYDGSYHNSSQGHASHSAESLRSRPSYGSLRSQRTTFTSATAPSPLLYPKSLQPWITESLQRTRRGQSGWDHREGGSATLGLPLRSTLLPSTRPIEIAYGSHNSHVPRQFGSVSSGRPLHGYVDQRNARRTLPQLPHPIHSSERIGHQLSSSLPAEVTFRDEGEQWRPRLPLFYDYTEDFAEEEFYSAKDSLPSLPPSTGKESIAEDLPNSDEDALHSNKSYSDGVSSDIISSKQSQRKHDNIKRQHASPTDAKGSLPRSPEDDGYGSSNEMSSSDRPGKNDLDADQSEDSSLPDSPQKHPNDLVPLPLAVTKAGHQLTLVNAMARSDAADSHSERVSPSQILTDDPHGYHARIDRLVGFGGAKSVEAACNTSRQSAECRDLGTNLPTSPCPRLSSDTPVGPVVKITDYRDVDARKDGIVVEASHFKDNNDALNIDKRETAAKTIGQERHGEDSPVLLSKTSFPWLTADFTPPALDASAKLLTSSPKSKGEADHQDTPSFITSTSPWRKISTVSLSDEGNSGIKQVPKFKLRLHRSPVDKSSPLSESSHSHLNKSYPWTSMCSPAQKNLPKIETQDTSPDSKMTKFKLRVFRTSSSSAGKLIRFRRSDPTEVTRDSHPSAIEISRTKGDGNKDLALSEGSEQKFYKNSGPAFWEPNVQPGSGGGLFEDSSNRNKDPVPAIHPVLSLAIDNPSELRSVFSDDSSEREGQSSIRERLNSLRAKFAVSQVFRAQGSVGSNGSIRHPFSLAKKSVQPGSPQPTKSFITGGRSRTRRVVDRLKRWIARRKAQASRYRKRFARDTAQDSQTAPLAA